MITTHTQLLNALAEKYGLQNYLEIGVQSKSQNYNKIICPNKTGIDPAVIEPGIHRMTSDGYFKSIFNNMPPPVFDLVFIDGDHTKEQVKRDFENTLKYLSDHGYIVVHDVLPENEAGTIVPRQTKQWWGDVYKWAMGIKNYNGISYITYNIDNGCMVVKREAGNAGVAVPINADWNTYLLIGKVLMNVQDEVTI